MQDAVSWLIWAGLFLWIGFTFGYFYRKWLEVSFLPRYQASREGSPGAGDPMAEPRKPPETESGHD